MRTTRRRKDVFASRIAELLMISYFLSSFLILLLIFSSYLDLESMSADLRSLRRYILNNKTIFQILRVLKNIDRRLENKLSSIRRNVENINFRVTRIQLQHRNFVSLELLSQIRNTL